jgi:hypothetical protein
MPWAVENIQGRNIFYLENDLIGRVFGITSTSFEMGGPLVPLRT